MNRDRNLLFGILAVQLNLLTSAQLMDVAGAWAMDPSRDLSERLMESGLLEEKDRALLMDLVERAVQAHGGDAGATLNRFGGQQQVYTSFHGSIGMTAADGVVSRLASPVSAAAGEVHLDPDSIPGVKEAPERYTQLGECGRGGMGRVLLVSDTYLHRDIALKELLPEYAPATGEALTPVRRSLKIMARFLQEARITGQLEHPGIVPVYELGYRRDGTLYYTMKLVRGRTLASAIREAERPDSRLELLSNVIDLCQAIAYAHSRAVIHRDIKPDNVMVGEFGETVVLDWGLAKVKNQEDVHAVELARTVHAMLTGDDAALAHSVYGEAIGTPMYMPPEQARGELDKVDERSDVYSLGAVLYELLTGEAPHRGENLAHILYAISNDPLTPVCEKAPHTPPELAAVCEKALAKDPADRYPSARALAEDLQRFQTGAMVEAHEYRFSEHLRRFVRRHRPVLATVAASLLLLLGLGAYSYGNIIEARDQERTARQRLERALYTSGIRLAQSQIERGDYYQGQKQLLELPSHLRHWEWGWLMRQVPPALLLLSGHEDGVESASYSPDGRRIVTASLDSTVRVWDAETGEMLAVLSGHEDWVNSASFSPDGCRIVTAIYDRTATTYNTVRVWDAETGEMLVLLSGHKAEVWSGSFSPDGRRIVTASYDGTARVWNSLPWLQ
jgi:serine/threonine protein kinase